MIAQVPEIDRDSINSEASLHLRLIDAEAKSREKLNREADQRYWLRWLVIAMSVLLVVGMAVLLVFVVCRVIFGGFMELDQSVQVTAYLAPITSMTAVTIALLIAAFRGYKETDEEAAKSGIREATQHVAEQTVTQQ